MMMGDDMTVLFLFFEQVTPSVSIKRRKISRTRHTRQDTLETRDLCLSNMNPLESVAKHLLSLL
jgi:hypothetical protein